MVLSISAGSPKTQIYVEMYRRSTSSLEPKVPQSGLHTHLVFSDVSWMGETWLLSSLLYQPCPIPCQSSLIPGDLKLITLMLMCVVIRLPLLIISLSVFVTIAKEAHLKWID